MVFIKISPLEVELGETLEEKEKIISELIGRAVRVKDSEQGIIEGTNRGDFKDGKYNVYNWKGDFFLEYEKLQELYVLHPSREEVNRFVKPKK